MIPSRAEWPPIGGWARAAPNSRRYGVASFKGLTLEGLAVEFFGSGLLTPDMDGIVYILRPGKARLLV